jgi:hypothetical protein
MRERKTPTRRDINRNAERERKRDKEKDGSRLPRRIQSGEGRGKEGENGNRTIWGNILDYTLPNNLESRPVAVAVAAAGPVAGCSLFQVR